MKLAERKKILAANIEEHKKEAKYYNLLHLELYNKFEQRRLSEGIREIISKINKNKIDVLDVGAGTGNLSKIIINSNKNKKFHITAIDISKEMQFEMKKDLGTNNIEYYCADIDNFLKNTKTKYDLIVISSVLHHLPDYISTLNNLTERLKKNGILYATHEPLINTDRSHSFFYVMLNFFDRHLYYAKFIWMRLIGKVPRLNLQYSEADYHTKDGGISPKLLINKLKAKNILMKNYSVNYFTSKISNKYNYFNCFELIINESKKN